MPFRTDCKVGSAIRRRDFLGRIAAAGCAIGFGAMPSAGWGATAPVRNGRPYMKLSLAAYSFNRFLPRNWPEPRRGKATMTLIDFIHYCAELDLDGCELTSYYFPRTVSEEYLASLKELTFRLGLDISGTAVGNDFCLPTGDARTRNLAMMRQWIDYSALMGAPVIRIFAGSVPAGDTEQVATARCIEGINECLDYAAERGVFLALENHGGLTASTDSMLQIIEGVKNSPWFGVNFDSGNFKTADPYRDLERIAPYAINAQVKIDVKPDGKSQPADFERVIRILRDAGYRGYVVLEYEGDAEPKQAIPRYIDELRKLIQR